MQLDEIVPLCQRLWQSAGVELEGIYTHFSSADDDASHTGDQLNQFKRVLSALRADGFAFKYIHAANSAGILNCQAGFFNLVRPGLMLYGYAPSATPSALSGLRPVMSWKTCVAQVKTLPAGSPIGYGNTYRTQGEETVAILPVGYADGLRRSPRSWREVLVGGRRAPLIGRVSMEKIAINVSHIPNVKVGDEAVLLGRQGNEEICADEVAEWQGTINYEVLTSIAPRVPRVYLEK